MKRWLFPALLLLIAGLAHAHMDAPLFNVESKNRFTFGHRGILASGDRVKLRFLKLAPNDVFQINKCGKPCNTSKVVFYVNGRLFSEGDRSFEIKEDGTYYFWIQRTLDGGETGPSHIDKFEAEGARFKATFMTNSIISGELERRPK